MSRRNARFPLGIMKERALIVGIYLVVLFAALYSTRLISFFPVAAKPGLHVYIFADVVDSDLFVDFEKEHGIPVTVTYFDSNEEMFTKFMINKGYGYDLVMASDYIVHQMIENGLVQKIDKAQIPSFAEVDKRLLSPDGDPNNDYAIPLCWTVTGIGYSKKFFGRLTKPSLSLVFDPAWRQDPKQKRYSVTLPEDPRDAMVLASLFSCGTSKLAPENFETIKRALINQKPWVELYTNSSLSYYLQAGIVPLVISWAAFMKTTLEEYGDEFDFVLPSEGTVYSIEHLLVPVGTQKKEEVHKLIEYLFSAPAGKRSFEVTGFSSANKRSYELIDQKFARHPAFFPSDDAFKKIHRLDGRGPKEDLIDIWIEVKGS